ncbi:hypothetical protein HY041_01790, partial [Candidatus Roizmanbacteria bacterium]|nr:hypothetical protein [Candidatus Roizmanbacteria bacterium]
GKEILERFQHETHSFGKIEFIHSDFLDYNFSDGDVFFIHATCFPDNEMDKLTKKLERIKRGSRIITVTKNLNSDSFQELEHTDQQMSWGKATIYYYIRV